MSDKTPQTLLCLASYFKGVAFLREAKRLGNRVFLLTAKRLENEDWPRDILDDIFYIEEEGDEWDIPNLIKGVSYLARTVKIDKIVALDDFDLEKASALREHLRVPGMGDTRTRYFRDKLAMRVQARDHNILVPAFIQVLHHPSVHEFTQQVPPPWALKPRSQASAVGIKKVQNSEELWKYIEELGDEQSYYLLEEFVPGDIYHVDSVVFDSKVLFARAHRYMASPWEVTHHGGIFRTHTVAHNSEDDIALREMNQELVTSLGLVRGVSHTEFIKGTDGKFYFLETSARVGGANIAEMVEAGSGVNLWAEWAKIKSLRPGETYQLPETREEYSGIIISLARQEWPDTSAYNDPEIAWRLNKKHHAGLIVHSKDQARVIELLDNYAERFQTDFFANLPAPDKPTS